MHILIWKGKLICEGGNRAYTLQPSATGTTHSILVPNSMNLMHGKHWVERVFGLSLELSREIRQACRCYNYWRPI
jgi:hypothetical protein